MTWAERTGEVVVVVVVVVVIVLVVVDLDLNVNVDLYRLIEMVRIKTSLTLCGAGEC